VNLTLRPVHHVACALAFRIDKTERTLKKSASPEIAARLFPQDACGLRLDAKHVLSVPEFGTSVTELGQVFEHALPYLEAQRPDPAAIVRLRVG
jgi:hypothetical protein